MSHRGGNRRFVENTLPAFRHSAKLGADLLECDVQETRDGQVVIFHDQTLDRMCQIPNKKISDFDFKDLPTLYQNLPGISGKAEGKIPLLSEVLTEFPHYPIQIDLKRGGKSLVQKTYEMIKDRPESVLWGSFHYTTHKIIRNLFRDKVPIFFPFYRLFLSRILYHLGLMSFLTIYEQAAIIPELFIHQGYIKALQARGVQVIVFGNLNSHEKYDRMKSLGVDGVCTDDPELMRQWLRNKSE